MGNNFPALPIGSNATYLYILQITIQTSCLVRQNCFSTPIKGVSFHLIIISVRWDTCSQKLNYYSVEPLLYLKVAISTFLFNLVAEAEIDHKNHIIQFHLNLTLFFNMGFRKQVIQFWLFWTMNFPNWLPVHIQFYYFTFLKWLFQ